VTSALPESFGAALEALAVFLKESELPAIIVGGVAASLLGRPRLTQDIDVLVDVPDEGWDRLLVIAATQGIAPRIGAPLDFARKTRVLLLRHTASGIDIDVIFGALQFEREAVGAGTVTTVGSLLLRLPRVEDLMIMKAIAHRPRDLVDLEGLLLAHPEADIDRVRHWVGEFAVAATMPELLEDLEKLIGRQH
jgi:hypothetical protein